jgi:hypothetical protein
VWEGGGQQRADVFGKVVEGVVAALEAVDEDEEERLAHFGGCDAWTRRCLAARSSSAIGGCCYIVGGRVHEMMEAEGHSKDLEPGFGAKCDAAPFATTS